MWKVWLIEKGIKILSVLIALGIGIWYLSSSIGGASLSYTSVDGFMQQISTTNGETSTINGCFLCNALSEMFAVLGRATETFWNGMVKTLWILISVGFGVFIIYHTVQYIRSKASDKAVINLTDDQPDLDFSKWFDKVVKTGIRILFVGALLGAIGWAGTGALKTTTNIIVTPVMYLGSALSSAATGAISNGSCELPKESAKPDDILNPVLQPFMCVMGNLNTVMLAGAAGGFALMNYAWMDLDDHGGGLFTWVAGLALVIMFLVIGFDLLFQVLTVIFKLIFIIIFMPLLLAAAAFEKVWKLADKLTDSALTMLIDSAIAILKISLKICIIYGVVYFSADSMFPGPVDGFTTILPPLLNNVAPENPDSQTMSVMNVFSECEKVSLIDGKTDKDTFKTCFKEKKAVVEEKYPRAFYFMSDGFDFMMLMICIFFLYFWVVSPQIDKLLNNKDEKDKKEQFDYGGWIKDVIKVPMEAPNKLYQLYRKQKDKKA